MGILHKISTCVHWVAGFVIVVTTIALKTDSPSNWWPWVVSSIDWIQYWAFFLVLPAVAVIPVCKWLESFLQKRRLLRSHVTSLLIHAHRVAFKSDTHRKTPHHYRATLFKKHWCKNRLIIVARSSQLTKNSKTSFRISDNPKMCEGVTGRAWAGETVYVSELPEIKNDSTEETIEKYASETGVKTEWIHHRISDKKDLARSYLAMPVEVHGERWGVLVWDSISPDSIRYDKKAPAKDKEAYNFIAVAIAKLLERVWS